MPSRIEPYHAMDTKDLRRAFKVVAWIGGGALDKMSGTMPRWATRTAGSCRSCRVYHPLEPTLIVVLEATATIAQLKAHHSSRVLWGETIAKALMSLHLWPTG